jgi:hypothetical protein
MIAAAVMSMPRAASATTSNKTPHNQGYQQDR